MENTKALISKVAIVGRPNVGKSTLFNILTDSRKSVVKNQPGVTRDIIIETATIWGKDFDLIDTGGITEAHDTFSKMIKEQVTDFLSSVDFLVCVMDGRDGLMPEDQEIIRIAKTVNKPFCLVINKVDRMHESELALADFYGFGVDLIATSFEKRTGVGELMDWIHKKLPENTDVPQDSMTISIVGKPNVGKSSMVNYLLRAKRMLVSDIAGTTVDSVDTPFVYNDKKYTLVDTAGLRKSAKRDEDIEIIAAFKSHDSIRRSDIVLLMIDANEGPSDQDARIMQSILEDHKGVIIVANKTDTAKLEIPEFKKAFREKCDQVFHFFDDVRIAFTSAQTGQGVEDMLKEIEWMAGKLTTRISTADLNNFFFEVIRKAPAPVYGITNVKFYYLTQTNQQPPAFIAFANHPDGVDNSYRRFLIKNLKQQFELKGVPIRIFVMKSKSAARKE